MPGNPQESRRLTPFHETLTKGMLMKHDKEAQARYYNDRFRDFDYANSLQLERAVSILDALRRTGLDKPRILDFGCGPGWLSNILSTFGPTTGVDLSPEAIAAAIKRYPEVSYEAVDVFNWDYLSGAFDVVVSQEVLEHVEDQARYLDMASDLLCDRGFLILTTPNARTMMAMPEAKRREWTNQPLENWVTSTELRSLLQRRFKNIKLTTITFGMGSAGSYRLVNSTKLGAVMTTVGGAQLHDWLRGSFVYGLHLVALAQKR
jgi:2-polyprenyl-3-methyl-5-hydroxy-6-metoxy-1,4-benzoquinol methylase